MIDKMNKDNNDSVLMKIKKAENKADELIESANKKSKKTTTDIENKAMSQKAEILKIAESKVKNILDIAEKEANKEGNILVEKTKKDMESYLLNAAKKKAVVQDMFIEELMKLK